MLRHRMRILLRDRLQGLVAIGKSRWEDVSTDI